MVNEKLVEYIKTNLSRGIPLEEIKETLLKVGWKEDVVNEAIDAAFKAPLMKQKQMLPELKEKEQRQQPNIEENIRSGKKKKSGKIAVILLGIIFIAAIVVIGINFFPFQKVGQNKNKRAGLIKCGSNLNCFLDAAQSCQPAILEYKRDVTLFSLVINTTTLYVIDRPESEAGCQLYIKIEDQKIGIDEETKERMLASGLSEEEINETILEANQDIKNVIGLDATCRFSDTSTLTSFVTSFVNETLFSFGCNMVMGETGEASCTEYVGIFKIEDFCEGPLFSSTLNTSSYNNTRV